MLVPGICAAICSMRFIAWPELTPGAGCPWISNEGTPWKRDRLLGPVAHLAVLFAAFGAAARLGLRRFA